MARARETDRLVAELRRSTLYSEELGIALRRRTDGEYFKWFLASVLYGGRISETIAAHTYRAFARHRLLAPARILGAGQDFLVDPVMREGGYVRYDGQKSKQVLRDCEALLQDYRGSLRRLHERAADRRDLEARLCALWGVGPVTANIFLRELRPYWRKADPQPLERVRQRARELGLRLEAMNRKTVGFTRLEAGLIRLRRTSPGAD